MYSREDIPESFLNKTYIVANFKRISSLNLDKKSET